MSKRTITLHVFASAKGGVGKSTLSVVCAKLLAAQGRRCVLIDADLTGTSLADGLRLRAPKVAEQNGTPDFYAPPTGELWSRQETERLLDQRKNTQWEDYPPAPPFFNDILIRGDLEKECMLEALFWRHEVEDGVRYLPSSPFQKDVAIACGWLYREEPYDWLQRVMWMLEHLGRQDPGLSDVIIDLPPGLFVGGFTHETLVLLSMLGRKDEEPFPSGFPPWHGGEIDWRGRPFIVVTPDMNDLAVALNYKLAHTSELSGLHLVLNKVDETWSTQLREKLQSRYGDGLGIDNLMLARVDHLQELVGIFLRGDVHMDERLRLLRRSLLLEEG